MAETDGRPPQPTQWSGAPEGSSSDRTFAVVALGSEAETAAIAARLARATRAGDVLALWGDLGSGKTVFARGFIRACCGPDEEVPSPTFTLVQTYEPADAKGAAIWHFDLYRLGDPDDALELDIEDAFASAISLIEWPDRLGPLLPAHRLDLALSAGDNPHRRLLTIGGDARWQARLREVGVV